jgi:purine-binding chemotaxis protein CheW
MKTPEEYLQEQVVLPEHRTAPAQESLEQEFIRRYVDPGQDLPQPGERQESHRQMPASREEDGPAEPKGVAEEHGQGVDEQPAASAQQDETEEGKSPGGSRRDGGVQTPEVREDEPGAGSGAVQLVGFSLKGQEYTLPITDVHEVIRRMEPTRLPTAPAHILGMINLRGKITPVIDLGLLLGKETDAAQCAFIVVCRCRDLQIGLLVDRMTTMHNVAADQVEWSVEAHLGGDNLYLAGLIKYEGNLTGIIALDRLVEAVLDTQ